MTERDLRDLEQVANIIVAIIERHRVQNENATERRAGIVLQFIERKQEIEENRHNIGG